VNDRIVTDVRYDGMTAFAETANQVVEDETLASAVGIMIVAREDFYEVHPIAVHAGSAYTMLRVK